MYLRTVHAESSLAVLRQFIHDHPLGVLTTFIPSPNFPSLQQTHIPWVLDDPLPEAQVESRTPSESRSAPALGTLRGHLARANPHAKALLEAVVSATAMATAADTDTDTSNPAIIANDCTVLFTLPASHYITPQYYTATKPESGKVVPTYNYAAVQVYGRLKVYADTHAASSSAEYLQRQIEDLTAEAEARAGYVVGRGSGAGAEANTRSDGGKGAAWQVSDAPASFIKLLKKAILGIEVEITDLQGKWKMSQELVQEGDREGVVRGLEAETEADVEVGAEKRKSEGAREVSRLVRERARRAEA